MKHSPTPWKVNELSITDAESNVIIAPDFMFDMTNKKTLLFDFCKNNEDALFLIEAVNQHDALSTENAILKKRIAELEAQVKESMKEAR